MKELAVKFKSYAGPGKFLKQASNKALASKLPGAFPASAARKYLGEKGKAAENAILQQVLLYGIACQLRRLLLVASVDAAQCYNRIAYAAAALTLRAYRVKQSSVACMLAPIQTMEYYLRTR